MKLKHQVSWLMVVLVLGGLFAAPLRPTAQAQAWPQGGVSAQAFAAPAGYIVHGVHLNPTSSTQRSGVPNYVDEIANFQTAAGKNLGIVMYFRPWDSVTVPCDDGFLPHAVDAWPPNGSNGKPGINPTRAIMLTWEPRPMLANPGPSAYDNVLSGQYDTLITNCANQLKQWSNKTFIIRYMHEMNITDSPWWAGHSYNQRSDGTGDTDKFKQTWRYVWQKFHDLGVTNVQWLWSPNWGSNPPDAWNAIPNYYPGDQYVDWIGLSGYNWFPYLGYAAPQTYVELYDGVLQDLQCRYAKPILHAEIGSTHTGEQSKTAWMQDAYTRLQTYPLLRAVVWFNDYAYHNTSQADFRVWQNTNVSYVPPVGGVFPADPLFGSPQPASITTDYKNQIADTSFTATFDASKLMNPPTTRCAGDTLSSDSVLSTRTTAQLVGRSGATATAFRIGALGLPANATLGTVSGCAAAGLTCTWSDGTLTAPWDAADLAVSANGSSSLGTHTLTITDSAARQLSVQVTVLDTLSQVYLPLAVRP